MEMRMALPEDISGGGNIWLSIFGIISLIISVVIGPAVLEWIKARIAKRSNSSTPVAVGGGGLNAPIDAHTPGVTGFNIEAMFSTVTDLQIRVRKAEAALDTAHDEIADLKRGAEFYQFVLDQVMYWGINNDLVKPPRPLPENIKALLQRGGWM